MLIIDKTPYSNLYLNTDQGHLDFTMACGSGRIIADLVADREPEIDVMGLALQRPK